ncbi:MAG: sugar phosphate nucleotidyltransferase [Duodenibacillus sp.]
MRALILAAGRGERLRPWTDTVPKPLLPVGGKRLCDWQLAALARAGVHDVVFNTAHLADAFETLPAELASKGIRVRISREGNSAAEALESLGGIVRALPLLSDDDTPFIVEAGDVVPAFAMGSLTARAADIAAGQIDAHLVAVPNPDYHAAGDMTVAADGSVTPGTGPHTYGCLMVACPRIFRDLADGRAKLFPWLWDFARAGRLTAEVFEGFWANVGDPQQYAALAANAEALRLLEDF